MIIGGNSQLQINQNTILNENQTNLASLATKIKFDVPSLQDTTSIQNEHRLRHEIQTKRQRCEKDGTCDELTSFNDDMSEYMHRNRGLQV